MATHSSILAWKTPWTEEPGGCSHGVPKSQTCLSADTHPPTRMLRPLSFVHPVKMAATTPFRLCSCGCHELCLAPPSGREGKCRFLLRSRLCSKPGLRSETRSSSSHWWGLSRFVQHEVTLKARLVFELLVTLCRLFTPSCSYSSSSTSPAFLSSFYMFGSSENSKYYFCMLISVSVCCLSSPSFGTF